MGQESSCQVQEASCQVFDCSALPDCCSTSCDKKYILDTLHPGGPRGAGYATAGLPVEPPSTSCNGLPVEPGTPRSVQLSRGSHGNSRQQEKPKLPPFKRQYPGSIAEAISDEIASHVKDSSVNGSESGELKDEWRTSVAFVNNEGVGLTASMRTQRQQEDRELSKHWLTNPHVFWRHPWARILVAFLVLAQDCFLYAEDPVNDSHVEANLPGVGHIMSFLFNWPSSLGATLVRFWLLVLSVVSGVLVGRQVIHHKILRDCLRLSAFSDCNGTFFVITITGVLNMLLASVIYNLVVSSDPQITGATGMQLRHFCKLCQCGSVTADLIAILMILDFVFQDRDIYPSWGSCLKSWWNEGCNGYLRIIFFWFTFVGGIAVTIILIVKTGKGEKELRWDNRNVGGLSEVTRAALVSGILTCDLLTVVQDWAFPTFKADMHLEFPIKIAGTLDTELRCTLLSRIVSSLCPTCPSFFNFFDFSVTGKWMTFGPLLVVVCLDLFCIRMQMIYDPQLYGQYVHPENKRVWTITDGDYLRQAYNHGILEKPEMIIYSARWNVTTNMPLSPSAATDIELNSRYLGSPFKWGAAIPGLVMLACFGALSYYGNKTHHEAVERAVHLSGPEFKSEPQEFAAHSTFSNDLVMTDGSKITEVKSGAQECSAQISS